MKKTLIIAIVATIITSTVSVLLNTKKIREKNKCEAAIEAEAAIHDSIMITAGEEIKIDELTKTLSWYITKEGEVKHTNERQTISCVIEQHFNEMITCEIHINGEEDDENRKYIDGAKLYKTTIDGKTAYFIADKMFIYTILWATEDGWAMTLKTQERN